MLIIVILMSTVYTGIVISLNRGMFDLPDVLVDTILRKQAESVSDYILRKAVRNANAMVIPSGYTTTFNRKHTFTNYTLGNCIVDSIRYSFLYSNQNFIVRTYLRATMQGRTISHTAEMGYNYPQESLGTKPNVVYLEMEKFLLFPWLYAPNTYLPDTSGNNYTATVYNILISATVPYGGAYSRMCAQFDGVNNYMTVGVDGSIGPATLLNTANTFTLVCFAKICRNGRFLYAGNQGTLIWIPSNPFDTNTASGGHPGKNLRVKPSAAIWFNRSDSTVRFTVTQNNSPTFTTIEASVPYTRFAVIYTLGFFNLWHYEYAWNSFALTFSNGVLRAYINGQLRSTVTSAVTNRAHPSTYGMTLGRRDLRYNNPAYNDYKYFCGLMDQVGVYDRALAGSEILSWHNGVLNAANILYIRD